MPLNQNTSTTKYVSKIHLLRIFLICSYGHTRMIDTTLRIYLVRLANVVVAQIVALD